MDARAKSVSYLSEGHGLLKKHGLYGNSDEPHFFAVDRALTNFAKHEPKGYGSCGSQRLDPLDPFPSGSCSRQRGGSYSGAAEAAAALQALYEAKLLVTARSSIEGRRIILGDWFMSLAVGLALPLRNARLAGLMSEELCRIGTDANRIPYRVSKQEFCDTIDRFTDVLCNPAVIASEAKQSTYIKNVPLNVFYNDNKLLSAIGSGYTKAAAAMTRASLSRMEAWFSARYDAEDSNEMDGWIYGAIMSGGKRMRPMLARLCAGLGAEEAGNDSGLSETDITDIMSTLELIHSASLVHDDIVDRSPMRRSRATINAEKGDGYAAMCGFMMIADALRLIGTNRSNRLIKLLSAIPMRMCGGELDQLDIENDPDLQSETEYFGRIACKTAALIEGSCVCGAIACGAGENTVKILSDFGQSLGLLFQLRDDLLDYGVPGMSGKPVSQDMERGIYSLPLLYARESLSVSDPEECGRLDAVLRKHIKEPSDFRYLNRIAESSGGISYTREKIKEQAKNALSSLVLLPRNTWTEALSLIVFELTDNYDSEAFFAENSVRLSNE